MLFDDNLEIREAALEMIKYIRDQKKTSKAKLPRKMALPGPHINFNASTYTEVLDFEALKKSKQFLSEPPLLMKYSIEELQKHASGEVELVSPRHVGPKLPKNSSFLAKKINFCQF